MFECIVAVASTVEVISNGSDGSRNGSLQLVCCSSTIKFIHFAHIANVNDTLFGTDGSRVSRDVSISSNKTSEVS